MYEARLQSLTALNAELNTYDSCVQTRAGRDTTLDSEVRVIWLLVPKDAAKCVVAVYRRCNELEFVKR